MVYSINSDFRQYNYNTTNRVNSTLVVNNKTMTKPITPSFTSNTTNSVYYNQTLTASPLRTRLETKDEKNKYNFLLKNLDRNSKKTIKLMLIMRLLL